MSDIKFTQEHEWLRLDEENEITVGITEYAQEQLGDVVYVELPEPGSKLSAGDEAATVESVKAAGEVNAPISGEITAVNAVLADEPELVNQAPLDSGWFYRMRTDDLDAFSRLMDETEYKEFLDTL